MKIMLLGFTKIAYMPYMSFYTNQIDFSSNEVHLVYWNRDEKPDINAPAGMILHPFKNSMSDAISLKEKAPHLIAYSRYARARIREVNPDFIIVLHSTTAVCVCRELLGKYAGKYIFDFRDVTYEHFYFYRNLVDHLIKKSALSFTSSDGFRSFLPSTPKLLTSHNINIEFFENRALYRKENAIAICNRIRIGFWGLLRHYELNRILVEKFGQDKRFELHYYGRAQGKMLDLMEYATNKFDNVYFHGEYRPEERELFAREIDMLHNIYDNSDRTTPIAMGNKYYDGIGFYVPQLCMSDSYMAKAAVTAGVGFACDPNDLNFTDEVYQYYQSLDRHEFENSCDEEFYRIKEQVINGSRKIKGLLEGKNR